MAVDDSNIYIDAKVLKLTFIDSVGCTFIVKKSVIGSIEMLRCDKCSVQIHSDAPLLQLGVCKNLMVTQHIPECLYILYHMGHPVSINFDGGRRNTQLSSALFSNMTIASVSDANGVVKANRIFALNEQLAPLVMPAITPDQKDESLTSHIKFGGDTPD